MASSAAAPAAAALAGRQARRRPSSPELRRSLPSPHSLINNVRQCRRRLVSSSSSQQRDPAPAPRAFAPGAPPPAALRVLRSSPRAPHPSSAARSASAAAPSEASSGERATHHDGGGQNGLSRSEQEQKQECGGGAGGAAKVALPGGRVARRWRDWAHPPGPRGRCRGTDPPAAADTRGRTRADTVAGAGSGPSGERIPSGGKSCGEAAAAEEKEMSRRCAGVAGRKGARLPRAGGAADAVEVGGGVRGGPPLHLRWADAARTGRGKRVSRTPRCVCRLISGVRKSAPSAESKGERRAGDEGVSGGRESARHVADCREVQPPRRHVRAHQNLRPPKHGRTLTLIRRFSSGLAQGAWPLRVRGRFPRQSAGVSARRGVSGGEFVQGLAPPRGPAVEFRCRQALCASPPGHTADTGGGA